MIKKIRKYLERRWTYLCQRGWEPKCGMKLYIARNTPYVRINIQNDPDYLETRKHLILKENRNDKSSNEN